MPPRYNWSTNNLFFIEIYKMISSKSFQELTYADKIACLKEIFGQITKQDPNLENIKYFLDTDFVFQDETLVNLFQMIEQGISE